MDTARIAEDFTAALRAGDFAKAESFWCDDVVSYEARDGAMREARGREAVRSKGDWWSANHDVYVFETYGPFINGDQFALRFKMDMIRKASGERVEMDEVGIYTVRNGKIVEERFFY